MSSTLLSLQRMDYIRITLELFLWKECVIFAHLRGFKIFFACDTFALSIFISIDSEIKTAVLDFRISKIVVFNKLS